MKPLSADRLSECYQTVRRALLAERHPRGYWEGELSTSPLSTATAVMALEMMQRQPVEEWFPPELLQRLIRHGLLWLAEHQNADGGWGDTVKSISNISTTLLCRATFRAAAAEERYAEVVRRAEQFIDKAGGIPAMVARYGRDRTFSVPILTHCALAGIADWNEVIPLPFYLAALPPRFYKTVRLPVVSYALPALIAIGQVGCHFNKPRNPFSRLLKKLTAEPTLRRLESIQPSNGGFLEATPLTSFVTMSLAGMGRADHPVARRGTQFLIDSVRPDGSWPIDTNLATWVTTLSVSALGDDVPAEMRPALIDWLLEQQYREVHPYTNADPGGWAWTDLPGGVPDGDDTPGAMLALMELQSAMERHSAVKQHSEGQPPEQPEKKKIAAALQNAVRWLLGLQNRDGGFPTFCRGWGTLPFDRSSPDITAHCLRALFRWLKTTGVTLPPPAETAGHRLSGRQRRGLSNRPARAVSRSVERGFDFLQRVQREDGSWLPLWFGNQFVPHDENPLYGTARVLAAYRDCGRLETKPARRGFHWLTSQQNSDGGWGGVKGTPSSIEETALAVEILLADNPSAEIVHRGLQWLCEHVEDGSYRESTPIGFYFAKLWYFEKLYPLIFLAGALRQACQRFCSASEPTHLNCDTPPLNSPPPSEAGSFAEKTAG